MEYQLGRVYLNGKGKRTGKGKEKDSERGMYVKGNKKKCIGKRIRKGNGKGIMIGGGNRNRKGKGKGNTKGKQKKERTGNGNKQREKKL